MAQDTNSPGNKTLPAVQNKPTHNPVFSKLVQDEKADLVGFLAYGFYKVAKKQWIVGYTDDNGHPPSQEECANFASHQTEVTLGSYRGQAEEVINEFLASFMEAQRPEIENGVLKAAVKGKFVRDFAIAFFAAFAFALVLLIGSLIAQTNGTGLPIQINIGHPAALSP